MSLKALGYQHQEIGRILRIDQKTLRRYLRLFLTGRIEALKQLNFYRPVSELQAHRELLKEEFEARPAKTIAEAVKRIETLTGLRRSPTQVRKFLQGLGLKPLKVGQIPAKANPDAQQTFLEEKLQPRLEEAKQGQRHLFFVDAAHFVMQPFLGFLWCSVRQFIQAPSGRQRFNVLGALHAITLQVITFTNETYINAQSVGRVIVLSRLLAAAISDGHCNTPFPNLSAAQTLSKATTRCLRSKSAHETLSFLSFDAIIPASGPAPTPRTLRPQHHGWQDSLMSKRPPEACSE